MLHGHQINLHEINLSLHWAFSLLFIHLVCFLSILIPLASGAYRFVCPNNFSKVSFRWNLVNKLSFLIRFSNRSYVSTEHFSMLVQLGLKRKMLTAQECSELYWTSPGGNTPQNSSWASRESSKVDEQDVRDTSGEGRMNS